MRSRGKMPKIIKTASKSGVTLTRDTNGGVSPAIHRGKMPVFNTVVHTEGIENPETHNNDRALCTPLNTNTFCGSVASNDLSSIIDGDLSSTPPSILSSTPSYTGKDDLKEQDCGHIDLILSINAHFYGIALDSEAAYPMPYYIDLGENPSQGCVLECVGVVQVLDFNMQDTTTGRLSRWAYHDGHRKILKRYPSSGFNLRACMPYLHNVPVDYNPPNYLGGGCDREILLPHYGYSAGFGVFSHLYNSAMCPAGCITQQGFMQFGEERYLICAPFIDYEIKDTKNEQTYPLIMNSIRTGLLSQECPNVLGEKPIDFQELFLWNVNFLRCGISLDTLTLSGNTMTFVESYAQLMATDTFVGLTGSDKENPESLTTRLSAAGIEYVSAIDIAGGVSFEDMADVNSATEATELIFAGWSGDDVIKFDIMLSKKYFTERFALVQNVNAATWYCYALFLHQDGDEDQITPSTVFLKKPPLAEYQPRSTTNEEVTQSQFYYYGFSTRPHDNQRLWAGCYEIYDWEEIGSRRIIHYMSSHAYNRYEIKHDAAIVEGGIDIGQINTSNALHVPWDWIEGHAGFRHSLGTYKNPIGISDLRLAAPLNDDYCDYHTEFSYTRPIFVRLYNLEINQHRHEYIDASLWRTDPDDLGTEISSLAQQGHRNHPELEDGEIEPVELGSCPFGGKTELWIGSNKVDTIDNGGEHLNPYQNIFTAATFHTNSGFTCVLYTKHRTLRNDAYVWLADAVGDNIDERAGYMNERYFWIRQSFHCAVIDHLGVTVAIFEVEATLPPDTKDIAYALWVGKMTQLAEPNQITEFVKTTSGFIKEGSTRISTKIDGHTIIIVDEPDLITGKYTGELLEQPDQHPGHDYVISSASVDYKSGVITVQYSVPPDFGEDVVFSADVWPFVDVLAPIHAYQEAAFYSTPVVDPNKGGYSALANAYPGIGGYMPVHPTVSITEDGTFLTIGLRVAKIKAQSTPRMKYGKHLADFIGLPNNTGTAPTIKYNDYAHQVLLYDMSLIELGKPKLIGGMPFLFPDYKKGNETMVLN